MTSLQARQFWTLIANSPKLFELPLDMRRRAAERSEAMTDEPRGVAFSPSRPPKGPVGLMAEPAEAREGAAILYFHGGGYVCGSPASRRKTLGHLADAARARAFAPAYRLAPEHRFPAAVEDALRAYEQLLSTGVDPARVVVAGDSAGGGLALAAALAAREKGLPTCAGLALISPWTDLSLRGESYESRAADDLTCARHTLESMAQAYLDGADARDPFASPLYADLAGLPPIFVVCGADEVLLDDSLMLLRRAAHCRVDACVSVVAGMQHVFPIWAGLIPEADEAIAAIAEFILAKTG